MPPDSASTADLGHYHVTGQPVPRIGMELSDARYAGAEITSDKGGSRHAAYQPRDAPAPDAVPPVARRGRHVCAAPIGTGEPMSIPKDPPVPVRPCTRHSLDAGTHPSVAPERVARRGNRRVQSVAWSPLPSTGLRPFRVEWANRSGATSRPLCHARKPDSLRSRTPETTPCRVADIKGIERRAQWPPNSIYKWWGVPPGRFSGSRPRQAMWEPPLTKRVEPVMKPAASSARNRTQRATSSGCLCRCG